MKIYLDCYPCFLRQALEASRIANADEKTQREVLTSVMKVLGNVSQEATPPQIGWLIHKTIREATGNPDPYKEIKQSHNELVLEIEPDLFNFINKSSSPVIDALKLAGTANLIDMGPERQWSDVRDIFEGFMNKKSDFFDYPAFESSLKNSGTLFYIGDNAGEIVLDKILIKLLIQKTDIDITYTVRGKPIINDATMEDARSVGITNIVKVIDTGADFPGVVLKSCSEEFLQYYYEADMILAKGQGNYESLSEEKENIFFLLQAKCPVIADKIGCKVGDLVLKAGRDQP
ncbi:hypothetical protein HY02_07355 [Peptococcaceae bacterium SCADC1_2_3]|nr:hypothetical protein DK28_0214510 [Peptococcaceae bacterium SCADC1_2_3]KFI37394.1 hypothetical protein HY02_07355 [Peptococcaceae bacterium SCADC1_2_3]